MSMVSTKGRLVIALLSSLFMLSACLGTASRDGSAPAVPQSPVIKGERLQEVHFVIKGTSRAAALLKSGDRLTVAVEGAASETLTNPLGQGGVARLEVIPATPDNHLLLTVRNDRNIWGWVLILADDSLHRALEVQVDEGVTVEGEMVKASSRKYRDGGGYIVSSTFYAFDPATTRYQMVEAPDTKPVDQASPSNPFSVESLAAVSKDLAASDLPQGSYVVGFNFKGMPAVWAEVMGSRFQSDMTKAKREMPLLAESLLKQAPDLHGVWVSTEPGWFRIVHHQRSPLQEPGEEWPVGYHTPLIGRGDYQGIVEWHLREVFGDRLLDLKAREISVNQFGVVARIQPGAAAPDSEAPFAFVAVMGRLGNEIDRVGELVLEFEGQDQERQTFAMNWVQFEWWRRAGLKATEWKKYSEKPVDSWKGARWTPWTAVGDAPPNPSWAAWADQIERSAPGTRTLFMGWNNGGLMVVLWVPAGDSQEAAWARQKEVASGLMAMPLVHDLRLISPGEQSLRIAKLSRDRYALATTGKNGESLSFDRIPSSHWPLLTDWYWDDEERR